MVLLQLAFCSPPYDYVSLLCNVSGLLREGQRELSVCFLDRSQASSPSSSSTSSSVSCQVTEGQTRFFLSYLADLSLLLGNLQLHLRIKIPGKFSQTRPQASFARLFFQAVSHERHLIPRQTELSFSAAEKKGPKVRSNVVCERISLFSAPSFQGSWVPG